MLNLKCKHALVFENILGLGNDCDTRFDNFVNEKNIYPCKSVHILKYVGGNLGEPIEGNIIKEFL